MIVMVVTTYYTYMISHIISCVISCIISFFIIHDINLLHITHIVSSTSNNEVKVYLSSEPVLSSHIIWRKSGFWTSALLKGTLMVMRQMNSAINVTLTNWDDLTTDELREAVIREW